MSAQQRKLHSKYVSVCGGTCVDRCNMGDKLKERLKPLTPTVSGPSVSVMGYFGDILQVHLFPWREVLHLIFVLFFFICSLLQDENATSLQQSIG